MFWGLGGGAGWWVVLYAFWYMTVGDGSTMTAKGKKPDAKELAERLRANLKRRKQQRQGRQAKDATTGRDDNPGDGK